MSWQNYFYHDFKISNVHVVGCIVWTCLKWKCPVEPAGIMRNLCNTCVLIRMKIITTPHNRTTMPKQYCRVLGYLLEDKLWNWRWWMNNGLFNLAMYLVSWLNFHCLYICKTRSRKFWAAVFRMLLVPNNTSHKISHPYDNSTTLIRFSKF